MEHLIKRNDTEYYNHQSSDLTNNMNSLSIHNNSNNTPASTSAGATYMATSTPIMGYSAPVNDMTTPRTSRLPRPKVEEEWKKSSSSSSGSSDKGGWKTSGSGSLNKNEEIESWKMSGKPRHAQLSTVQKDDLGLRRQSAPVIRSPSWPKPLPQEPIQQEPFIYSSTMEDPYYNINTPAYIATNIPQQQQPFHITSPAYNNINRPIAYPPYNEPPIPPPIMNNTNNIEYIAAATPMIDYNPSAYNYPPQQQQEYPPFNHNEYPLQQQQQQDHSLIYPPPTINNSNIQPPIIEQQGTTLSDPPVNALSTKADETSSKKKKDTNAKPEKKVRQITVQSINLEHRVWIDVLPAETGLSLAEKIHIIATFRTRKIVSITTASGRKIPLDNRPVFGSWMDMESFEDGEKWSVEWRENDRGVVDKFMSKIIQAGGGKRTKDHVA